MLGVLQKAKFTAFFFSLVLKIRRDFNDVHCLFLFSLLLFTLSLSFVLPHWSYNEPFVQSFLYICLSVSLAHLLTDSLNNRF